MSNAELYGENEGITKNLERIDFSRRQKIQQHQ